MIAETANNDPTRLSVSLITVEFTPAGTRTKLTLTDQIVALEGMDMLAGSESGWSEVLGNLEAELRREHAHP